MALNSKSESPQAAEDDNRKVRQVEILISDLLRIGVILSVLIVIAGLVVTFIHHPQYANTASELRHLTQPGAAFPHTFSTLLTGLRQFQGRAIILLGLLVLIATPVMRVAVSIFAFVYEKDPTFVVITSVVLTLLLLSFFLGKGE